MIDLSNREIYVAPELLLLGSFEELTLVNGTGGNADSTYAGEGQETHS
jgi:hypothetical protein